MRRAIVRTAAALLMVPALSAFGQSWPAKPIHWIVPFAPGGGLDINARTIAPKLAEALGQPIVVENRVGAGGNVAADAVARAAPDGYTLLHANVGILTINPGLYSKLPFNPLKDFAPVSVIVKNPLFVVASTSIAAKSLQELIALAKQKPGTLNFASGGSGTINHLAAEMIKRAAGLDMPHIPYKGGGPAMVDLAAGRVHALVEVYPVAAPYVASQKARLLAVTTPTRVAAFPEVPTLAEAGLPGLEVVGWQGILAPAGTPKEIVERISRALGNVMGSAEMQQRLAGQGVMAASSTPEEFSAFIRSEYARWSDLVKATGAKVD